MTRRLLLCAALALIGCGDGESDVEAAGLLATPSDLSTLAEQRFFDHPWPSDFRRAQDGTLQLDGFPNPRLSPLIDTFVDAMAGRLHGFSPAAAGFLRFSAPIDADSVPASPLDALSPAASVQLIDIDPDSPERGQRKLITVQVRAEAGVYFPSNVLVFMPALGEPLLPSTRYALIVTGEVRSGGKPLRVARQVRQGLGLDRSTGAAAELAKAWAGAGAELSRAGVSPGELVHLTVFTTDDPVAETARIRDWVRESYPAPDVIDGSWLVKDDQASYDVYEGMYGPSPDFQRGDIPFVKYRSGGELAFDAEGNPELQRDFDLRFALSVPKATACPMPATGYPIVVYAHGTGGNYRSFLGPKDEGPALAKRCIATMGIDQIFHGTRPGAGAASEEVLFFNVENPVAARANGPQSAIDVVQQVRLFTETKIEIPASVARGGQAIRFDPQRVGFFGHSQGGVNGPIFMAVDDAVRGGVLSGAGAMISISLLEKTEPVNIAVLVQSVFLALGADEVDELSPAHPVMALAQTIVDPTDPVHYFPLIAGTPRSGFPAKSLLMTEGVTPSGAGDSYTPPHTIEVGAVAAGLPPQEPVLHPPAELAYSGLSPVSIPDGGLSGNLAGGAASGVLAQWDASLAQDGHFVIYDIPAAMAQCAGFMQNLMVEPKGRVPRP